MLPQDILLLLDTKNNINLYTIVLAWYPPNTSLTIMQPPWCTVLIMGLLGPIRST